MRLSIGTIVYEMGKVSIREALRSAQRLGFEFVDFAAFQSGDPTLLTQKARTDVVELFKGSGFKSSQLLMINTHDIASSETSVKDKILDYMKRCADFQLELGGRQVLVCWGCGVYKNSVVKEQSWINAVSLIREYACWCLDKKILIELELDPHVYFIVNNLGKMVKFIEDVGMPNVFPNIDVGHLCLTRESPPTMEKLKGRILHVHLSETDTFEHTNSIIGTGKADFKAYVDKVLELGIENNCRAYGEVAVAGIELGDVGTFVDDPERWIRESLSYLEKTVPELTL